MNDLRILILEQPPFYRAVAMVIVLLLMALAIGVVEGTEVSIARWFRRFRARRYFNKVVKLEQRDIRRRHLEAVARTGGRS